MRAVLLMTVAALCGCVKDTDSDGSPDREDCDTHDRFIYPGAPEVPYDGIDQDCDGFDLDDIDGDGFIGGANGSDCVDTDAAINPGAAEIPYDEIDQDCDGADLDDVDGDGAKGGPNGDDCDDEDADRYPRADEIPYDGIDQDCDGQDLLDADGDGYDAEVVGGDDCDDTRWLVNPGRPEVPYNGWDDDCDGGDATDLDGDGFSGHPVTGDDCDDENADVNPEATEICGDGLDNDCDGAPICGFHGTVTVEDASAKIWYLGGESGHAFAGDGDLNGDGKTDLMVGAPDRGWGGDVFVFCGPIDGDRTLGDADAHFTAQKSNDELGSDMAIVPDVDGDGLDEMLIGAPWAEGEELTNTWPPNAGGVYLLPGDLSGEVRLSAEGSTAKWWGYSEWDNLGLSVDAAGDVDGDGTADFIMGAPDEKGDSAGWAYVVRGPSTGLHEADKDAWLEIRGSGAPSSTFVGAEFGRSVAGLGDTDGDGLDDVGISAYQALNYNGQAYVVLGGGSGGSIGTADVDIALQGARYDGQAARFGQSIDAAGDFNGDGYDDLVAGEGEYGPGRVRIFFGPLTGGVAEDHDDVFIPSTDDVALGEMVAGVGDLNGDGKDDVAVSAPRVDDNAGAVYVVFGGQTGELDTDDLPTILGEGRGDSIGTNYTSTFARSLRKVGDLDDDGYDDLAIGAPLDNADGSRAGRVYLFFGGPGL